MPSFPICCNSVFVVLAIACLCCTSGSPGVDVETGGEAGQAGDEADGGADEPGEGGSAQGGAKMSGGTGGRSGSAGNGGGMTGLGSGGASDGNVGACPTAPPFDESNEALVAKCTRPLVAAVGNGLRRAFSYDGQTWFGDAWNPGEGPDQNEESHRDVAIGNGLIVMVGDGGIFTSLDGGVTLKKKDTGRSLHNSAVVFFRGAFWVMGGGGVHTSTDGVAWKSWKQDETLPGGLKASFGASDGTTDGKIALFVSGGSYRIWNGETWTQGSAGNVTADSIVYGKDRFAVVSGFRNSSGTSTNGTTWMGGSSAGDLRFDSIVWNGTQFFASGSQYDIYGQTSVDGLNWTRHRMSHAIGPVTRFGNVYVGANAATLYRSNDARIWTHPHKAVGETDAGFTSMASGPVLKGATP